MNYNQDFQDIQTSQMHLNGYDLQDFIIDTNFEQFIDLITNDPVDIFTPFHQDEILFGGDNGCDQFFASTPEEATLGFNSTSNPYDSNLIAHHDYVLPFSVNYLEEMEETNDEDYSGTMTSTNLMSKKRSGTSDDSRSIITSERRRRVRMKEKLYALRALVPNITKMDKASIVGDAVLYVKELQMQAKKLKAEITNLESSSSMKETRSSQEKIPINTTTTNFHYKHPIIKKIVQMDIVEMDENVYHVRLVSNKGEGVAVGLYKALDSLTSFDVQSSSFATFPEKFVFTFIVNVKQCGEEMSLSSLKLWVNRALLNQGFEHQ